MNMAGSAVLNTCTNSLRRRLVLVVPKFFPLNLYLLQAPYYSKAS